VWKPDGMLPLGGARRRWVDNIRMDLWCDVCIGSGWGKRSERNHWGDLSVVGLIKIEWICGEIAVYTVLVVKCKERDRWGYLGVNWLLILGLICGVDGGV
jgi:hypothetical protein